MIKSLNTEIYKFLCISRCNYVDKDLMSGNNRKDTLPTTKDREQLGIPGGLIEIYLLKFFFGLPELNLLLENDVSLLDPESLDLDLLLLGLLLDPPRLDPPDLDLLP